MQDRPTALELLQAIRDLLEQEILPSLTDARLKYQTLIAINALRMLEREVPDEAGRLRAEFGALEELLGRSRTAPPRHPPPRPRPGGAGWPPSSSRGGTCRWTASVGTPGRGARPSTRRSPPTASAAQSES